MLTLIGVLAPKETFGHRDLVIRFLAGAWCVSCFVLITAYSSVRISFVTSPYYKPIIDSIYDLPQNSSVKLVVDRGLFPDLLFAIMEY